VDDVRGPVIRNAFCADPGAPWRRVVAPQQSHPFLVLGECCAWPAAGVEGGCGWCGTIGVGRKNDAPRKFCIAPRLGRRHPGSGKGCGGRCISDGEPGYVGGGLGRISGQFSAGPGRFLPPLAEADRLPEETREGGGDKTAGVCVRGQNEVSAPFLSRFLALQFAPLLVGCPQRRPPTLPANLSWLFHGFWSRARTMLKPGTVSANAGISSPISLESWCR
jgi:hypothetical protein